MNLTIYDTIKFIIKTNKFVFLLMIVVSLMSACHRDEQLHINPQLTDLYSLNQVDSLLHAFSMGEQEVVKLDDNLKQVIKSNFGKVSDIEWEVANNIKKVEFEINDVEFEAFFDAYERLFAYKQELKEKDLPAIVLNSTIAHCPDYKIKEIDKYVRSKKVVYEIELKRSGNSVTLYLNNRGEVEQKVDF